MAWDNDSNSIHPWVQRLASDYAGAGDMHGNMADLGFRLRGACILNKSIFLRKLPLEVLHSNLFGLYEQANEYV